MTIEPPSKDASRPFDQGPGEDNRPESMSSEYGGLKITQDIVPSGLGLMPRWMAVRIAEIVTRGRSTRA